MRFEERESYLSVDRRERGERRGKGRWCCTTSLTSLVRFGGFQGFGGSSRGARELVQEEGEGGERGSKKGFGYLYSRKGK